MVTESTVQSSRHKADENEAQENVAVSAHMSLGPSREKKILCEDSTSSCLTRQPAGLSALYGASCPGNPGHPEEKRGVPTEMKWSQVNVQQNNLHTRKHKESTDIPAPEHIRRLSLWTSDLLAPSP